MMIIIIMTAICVTYNTYGIFKSAYESIRLFYPEISIIIIENSDKWNRCYKYTKTLRNRNTQVVNTGENIGHGDGMHLGLTLCKTKTALLFDSDIIMLKSPVGEMMRLMTNETYGVGWVYEIGRDGYDYGTPERNHIDRIPYLHPYFALLNVSNYFKFHKFVHHGAPCYKAMIDLYDKGCSNMLMNCDLLTGHTSGQGANWFGKPNDYIKHDFGGTRMANRNRGQKEITENWVK